VQSCNPKYQVIPVERSQEVTMVSSTDTSASIIVNPEALSTRSSVLFVLRVSVFNAEAWLMTAVTIRVSVL